MKKTILSAILIITAAVLSMIICSCGGKTPENGTTTSPTTAQQYIGTVPSGADIFDETDKAADGQTVAPNEPYGDDDSDDSGNNNGDKTTAVSGNSAVTAAKSTDKASNKTSAVNPSAKATKVKATTAKATNAATVNQGNKNDYDPGMPDIF